jgi:integrase
MRFKITKNVFPYKPARLVDATEVPYVIFYIWHLQKEKLVRKRISLKGATTDQKLKNAARVIPGINRYLLAGGHLDDSIPKKVEFISLAEPLGDELHEDSTVYQAYQYYKRVKQKDLRGSTIDLYSSYVRHLEQFLLKLERAPKERKHPEFKLSAITIVIANLFFDQLQQGGRYRNNMLGFMKSFYTFFIDRELIGKNPFARLKDVPVDESEGHRPFTTNEAVALREDMLSSKDEQLWLFCQFMYFLFLRPGQELRLLMIGDILDRQVRVKSTHGKNRRTGYVDIPKVLEESIQHYKLRSYPKHHYVFTADQRPGPVPAGINYFYKRHVKYLKSHGLFGFDYDLYSWKPTGAIALYQHTKDLLRVQRHCRHSTPDQTYTYLRKYGLVFAGQDPTDFPAIWL